MVFVKAGAGLAAYRTGVGKVVKLADGVVPGADGEYCPVCSFPSEGWVLEPGKRTWYHFRRTFNCVESVAHLGGESTAAAEAGEAQAVPEV